MIKYRLLNIFLLIPLFHTKAMAYELIPALVLPRSNSWEVKATGEYEITNLKYVQILQTNVFKYQAQLRLGFDESTSGNLRFEGRNLEVTEQNQKATQNSNFQKSGLSKFSIGIYHIFTKSEKNFSYLETYYSPRLDHFHESNNYDKHWHWKPILIENELGELIRHQFEINLGYYSLYENISSHIYSSFILKDAFESKDIKKNIYKEETRNMILLGLEGGYHDLSFYTHFFINMRMYSQIESNIHSEKKSTEYPLGIKAGYKPSDSLGIFFKIGWVPILHSEVYAKEKKGEGEKNAQQGEGSQILYSISLKSRF